MEKGTKEYKRTERPEKMKIYISGKITGLKPEEANRNFMEADRALREKGHKTVNPLMIAATIQDMDWKTFMGIAYAVIHDESIDAVYMLRNWKDSMGACIEWGWAQAAGIPVLYQDPADRNRFGRKEDAEI